MKETTKFGRNVLTLLESKNCKVSDMEQALHYGVGSIEKNYIYGKRNPSQELLVLIADYLEVQPEDLLNKKMWLRKNIATLKQELEDEYSIDKDSASRYSQAIMDIVPEEEKSNIFFDWLRELPIGELLVSRKYARNILYLVTAISALLYVIHPLLVIKIASGIVMCGCSILLNFTIKNKIKVDKYLEVFTRATFCLFSLIGIGGILFTF